MSIEYYIYLSAFLFCAGLFLVITKKNIIVVLMGIELMFNAANINLVAFSYFDPNLLQGQVFALFIIVIAAAESAVALAIVIQIYKFFDTIQLDQINSLKN